MRPRPLDAALLAVAFVSGAAALVYEIVWLRWFQLLFGNTAYAASATLCAFFTGLALGAALVGRIAGRARRPLLLYGFLELGVAAAALVVPVATALYDPIYASLYEALAGRRSLFVAVKYALALVAMLPATILLGGTLPPLAAAFVRQGRELGREGGVLYAVNTLGAASGAALASFWLMAAWGVTATYAVAIALSSTAGTAALLLARRAQALPQARPAAGTSVSFAPAGLLGVAFASGFGTLAFEVLLIQALVQVLRSTVFSKRRAICLASRCGRGLRRLQKATRSSRRVNVRTVAPSA